MSSTGPSGGNDGTGGEQRRSLTTMIRRVSRVLRPKSETEETLSAPTRNSRSSATAASASTPGRSTPAPASVVAPATTLSSPPASQVAQTINTGGAAAIADRAIQPEPSSTLSAPPSSTPAAASGSASAAPASVSASSDLTPAPAVTGASSSPVIPEAPKTARAHTAQQEAKARAMFSKYGLTLDVRDWTTSSGGRSGASEVEWVEKRVRMRIHRSCHRCGTSFGKEKSCANCSHGRCKTCPSFPAKGRTAAQKEDGQSQAGVATNTTSGRMPLAERAQAQAAPAPIFVSVDPQEQDDKMRMKLYEGLHRMRGQDLMYKPVISRVRRMCHKCDMIFKGKATICERCGHVRCPSCPREPPKTSKYPSGYPGDVEESFPLAERIFRKHRHRVRFHCDTCDAMFPNSATVVCPRCQHRRCGSCRRDPPKKIPRTYEDAMLRGLEGKMVGLSLISVGS